MSILNRLKNVFTGDMERENAELKHKLKYMHDRYAQHFSTVHIDLRLANSKIYAQQQELFKQLTKIRELSDKLEGNLIINVV